MIRKAVIVVLTVGAVASAVAFPLSLRWAFGHRGTGGHLVVMNGSVLVVVGNVSYFDSTPPPGWFWEVPRGQVFDLPAVPLTFLPRRVLMNSVQSLIWMLDLPLWTVFVVTATYPTIAFIRGPLRRVRRRRKGLCIACGYDLTGNVTGVCSECGVKV